MTFLPLTASPFSALLTNSVVMSPWLTAVMSHGPWMLWPAMVPITWPALLSSIRHPYLAVADLPLVVGRLPTTT